MQSFSSPTRFLFVCLLGCLLVVCRRYAAYGHVLPHLHHQTRFAYRSPTSVTFNLKALSDTSAMFTGSAAETRLLQLSTAHFTSQALHSFVVLGVADVFQDEESVTTLTVEDIAHRLKERKINPVSVPIDALYRILRLLTASDVVVQELQQDESGGLETISFGITDTGRLLQQPKAEATTNSQHSFAPFVLHWMENPIWDAFSQLPEYILDGSNTSIYPFDRAHGGMGAPEYYSQDTHANAKFRQHRSQVAQMVSTSEIPALMKAIDWPSFSDQTIVDIGGGFGDLMAAVSQTYNQYNLTCVCLDLPSVVHGTEAPEGVTLVPGDMFESETIPPCDAIITKHVLCDWPDEDVIRMLQSCHLALVQGGKLMIVDAVLVDGPDASNQWQIQTSVDVLLMLTGRHMDRSASQWKRLAAMSGFQIEKVISCPSAPSLNVSVLSKVCS